MAHKKRIYLDNAATTPLHPEVVEAMCEVMRNEFGNPSSIHSQGRRAKAVLEKARRTVAQCIGASPSEVFFTSGATESLNTVMRSLAENRLVDCLITSPLEHHAVLHTADHLKNTLNLPIYYVNVDSKGKLDLNHLEILLQSNPNALVSLMHVNNELGNLNPIDQISELSHAHKALFLCDTVQALGVLPVDVRLQKYDFLVGSAHKFYGPKGVGFFYLRKPIPAFIYGGAQERNMRGGTENLYGIIGLAKALELATNELPKRQQHLQHLKNLFLERLKSEIPDAYINGSDDPHTSSPKIVSVTFPKSHVDDLMLFQLDIEGVDASGGSACSSGSYIGSHVLNTLYPGSETTTIRFSFGLFNTQEEIIETIQILKKCYLSL